MAQLHKRCKTYHVHYELKLMNLGKSPAGVTTCCRVQSRTLWRLIISAEGPTLKIMYSIINS